MKDLIQVPLSEMWIFPPSKDIFRFVSYTNKGILLINVNDLSKKVYAPNPRVVFKLEDVSVGNTNVGRVLERLYELEESGEEIPTSDEMDEMKKLIDRFELIKVYPIEMSRIVAWYYIVMEHVDFFADVKDPYDNIKENENQNQTT